MTEEAYRANQERIQFPLSSDGYYFNKKTVLFLVPTKYEELVKWTDGAVKQIKNVNFGDRFLKEWSEEIRQWLWDYRRYFIFTGVQRLKDDISKAWEELIECSPEGTKLRNKQTPHIEVALGMIAEYLISESKKQITDELVFEKVTESAKYYHTCLYIKLNECMTKIQKSGLDSMEFCNLFSLQQGIQDIRTPFPT